QRDWDENTYVRAFREQAVRLLETAEDTLRRCAGGDEYVVFENRERTLKWAKAFEDAAGTSSHTSNIEGLLRRFRRLEDFQNKVIDFDVRGPVNARMEWSGGKNTLFLTVNVNFVVSDKLQAQSSYDVSSVIDPRINERKCAAIEGFKRWSGDYVVFEGRQQLTVVVDVDVRMNLPVSGSRVDVHLTTTTGAIRSFAHGGKGIFDWAPDAAKTMMLFGGDSYEDNVFLASHEIGHIFGLGDAYANATRRPLRPGVPEGIPESIAKMYDLYDPSFTLPPKGVVREPAFYDAFPLYGVEKGDYADLDQYGDYWDGDNIKRPETVMARNEHPIQPNDIEMVVLAFHTGKRQNYQQQFPWNEVSEALGKGE
ncbi:hypothetical protein LJC34_06585, partial [Oscillospiraceae bacterium OttesenSCG-928-G22]|nr:hypothetical protein [Oscillospiraceae bacterium OttesenSCG-928-G22]